MYDPQDDAIFGHDMRHKPPMADLLTSKNGWEGSHGRLAYSQMVRTQTGNVSEYAVRMLGGMPKGYIIVSEKSVNYDTGTAIRVSHGRVAIPVKEFARQRHLTLREQWELMNPQWVGTYFGMRGEDLYASRRPSLAKAVKQAQEDGSYEDFISQFWIVSDEHRDAIYRIKQRLEDLQTEAGKLRDSMFGIELKISKVESDIHYQRYTAYYYEGMNVHECLTTFRCQYEVLRAQLSEVQRKTDRIKEFIKNTSF